MKYLLGLVLSFLVMTSFASAEGFTVGSLCSFMILPGGVAGCTNLTDWQANYDISTKPDNVTVPLNGGYLANMQLPLPTQTILDTQTNRVYIFGNPGGSLDLTLKGETMLTGTFLAGGTANRTTDQVNFRSDFVIDYLNPELLKKFKLDDDFTGGTGTFEIIDDVVPGGTSLNNYRYEGGVVLSVTNLTTPEPNTGLLVGACFLASVVALLRRRVSGNCLTR
jgi:hypothetical protein